MFKIEVEDGKGRWSDVRGDDGNVLTFESEDAARAALGGAFSDTRADGKVRGRQAYPCHSHPRGR